MRRLCALSLAVSVSMGALGGASGGASGGIALAQQHDSEARAEYTLGKAAYEHKQFGEALGHFQKSYTLSGEAALLYNIASAQQSLDRPGDAAQSLRDYLAARPQDPQRVDVERRIRGLLSAQVVLDRETQRRRAVEAELAQKHRRDIELDRLRAEPAPGWLSESEAERRASLETERERRRRRKLAVGLGVGLGGLAVAGVVVGVVCGLGYCAGPPPKDFDFSRTTVTP